MGLIKESVSEKNCGFLAAIHKREGKKLLVPTNCKHKNPEIFAAFPAFSPALEKLISSLVLWLA